jgi:hypothetical protein
LQARAISKEGFAVAVYAAKPVLSSKRAVAPSAELGSGVQGRLFAIAPSSNTPAEVTAAIPNDVRIAAFKFGTGAVGDALSRKPQVMSLLATHASSAILQEIQEAQAAAAVAAAAAAAEAATTSAFGGSSSMAGMVHAAAGSAISQVRLIVCMSSAWRQRVRSYCCKVCQVLRITVHATAGGM